MAESETQNPDTHETVAEDKEQVFSDTLGQSLLRKEEEEEEEESAPEVFDARIPAKEPQQTTEEALQNEEEELVGYHKKDTDTENSREEGSWHSPGEGCKAEPELGPQIRQAPIDTVNQVDNISSRCCILV